MHQTADGQKCPFERTPSWHRIPTVPNDKWAPKDRHDETREE